MEEWCAKAHRDAPPLPWRGDQGEEIYSFAIVPQSETAGLRLALFDSRGREVVRHGDGIAILATCLALNSTPWELTFLPIVDEPVVDLAAPGSIEADSPTELAGSAQASR
jgi:hypothetical protein